MPQDVVGKIGTLPDGTRVRVTAVLPDGSMQYERVPDGPPQAPQAEPSAVRRFSNEMAKDEVFGTPFEAANAIADRGWSEAMPVIGGAVGSLIGRKRTPVAAALAAAGGGAGELIRQAAQGQPIDWRAAVDQAALQGGTELLGRGVQGGAHAFGTKVYTSNLKPGTVLPKEFPGAVQELLNSRVLMSRGGQGVGKVGRLIDQSATQAAQVAASADNAVGGAPTINPRDVVSGLQPFAETLRQRQAGGSAIGPDVRQLMGQVNRLRALPLKTVTEAVEAKRAQQHLADAAYAAVRRGAKTLTTEDELAKGTAAGWRAATEARAPALEAINARTQNLVGGKEMLVNAMNREGGNNLVGPRDVIAAMGGYLTGGTPGGLAAYAGLRALTTPLPASVIAIGANDLSKLPTAQLIRAMVLARLAADREAPKEPER